MCVCAIAGNEQNNFERSFVRKNIIFCSFVRSTFFHIFSFDCSNFYLNSRKISNILCKNFTTHFGFFVSNEFRTNKKKYFERTNKIILKKTFERTLCYVVCVCVYVISLLLDYCNFKLHNTYINLHTFRTRAYPCIQANTKINTKNMATRRSETERRRRGRTGGGGGEKLY